MKIDIQFDTRNLRARTLREKKNLAYSTSQALNETAKDIQQATRIRMDRIFHLRKAGFMYRLIKIFKFSLSRPAPLRPRRQHRYLRVSRPFTFPAFLFFSTAVHTPGCPGGPDRIYP